MRRALAPLVLGGLLTLAPPPPAAAQISLLGLQNSLIQFALARLSAPEGFSITAGRLTENEDGQTELVDVRVADGQGAWLEIDGASLGWNPARLLRGELHVTRLQARGVRVLRRPISSETAPPAEEDSDGFAFAWPRSPLTTRVDALRLESVSVAPGVIAAQGLGFDAEGEARDEGSEQAARLNLRRTDAVAGTIALDYLRDFAAGTLRLNLSADEAAGGVAAELAGFPPDSATRLNLAADGPLSDWAIRFDAEAERVFTARGEGAIDLGPPFALDAEIVAEPGEALPPNVAALLAPQARFAARAREGADGVIRIEEAALRAPELDLDVTGWFARATGALEADVALEARGGLSALTPGARFARAGFTGAARGALDDLALDGRLALEGLATAPLDVAQAGLDTAVRIAGGRVEAEVSGAASGVRLDRIGPETLGETRLAASAVWADETLTLDALTLAGPLLDLRAEGRADLAADTAALNYRIAAPELAPVAAAYGVAAGGALIAEGAASGALSAPKLTGEARLEGARFEGDDYGQATLRHDVTLGPEPEGRVAFAATGSPWGPVRVDAGFALAQERLALRDFAAEALGVEAEGAVTIDLATTLAEGALTARIADATQAAERLGARLSGAAELDVTLAVENGRQDATVNGQARGVEGFGARIEAADVDIALSDLHGDPSGAGSVSARSLAAGDAALGALDFEGEARALLSAPEGRAKGFATDVAAGGARTARIDIDAALDAKALVAALKIAPTTLGDIALGAARIDATLSDPRSENPVADARATLGASTIGPARLAETTLSVKGPRAALKIAAQARGALEEAVAGLEDGAPLALDFAATADARDPAQVEAVIEKLALSAADHAARLRRPARLVVGPEIALSDIDLVLPGGALSGKIALAGGGATGDLALAFEDMGPLADLAGAPLRAGALDATARFDTRSGSAGATGRLAARGLAFDGVDAELGDLDLDADLAWNGSRATANATLEGPFDQPVTASFATPLRPTGGPLPAIPAGAGAEGRLRWQGRIGELWALVPTSDNVLDGDMALDLGFAGALDAPRVSGTVSLRGGRYENLDIGTILTNLSADGRLAEDGAFAVTLTGDDAASGAVRLDARIGAGDLDATLTTRQAVLVRRDDATIQVSADIAARGPLAGPSIAGKVGIDRAEIRLVNANPPSVADLGPVRIKGAPIEEPGEPFGESIALDLTIAGARDIYVRGRGLDSEWEVDMAVRGTAAAPVVTGRFERIRGRLNLVGFPFELERGLVRFTGGVPVDPTLDIALMREANDVRGGIVVRGVASAPEIHFESRPALPEDEVLPRVLFGRSKQSLSSGEALQLAAGLATLLDGSGGAIDTLRATVGLDVLRIEGDPEQENAAVTAGQNVAPGVFVGVKQPLGRGNASVKVEIEVFDNVTVDSEVGQEGGPDVGVNWRKDF